MYAISEVAALTGITAYTLRYYEKIGLLPKTNRLNGKENGIRRYTDDDILLIRLVHGLKDTGMKLEDIAAFTEDGCLLTANEAEIDMNVTLHKRIEILDRHVERLNEQLQRLQAVKTTAQQKRAYYVQMLQQNAAKDLSKV